MNELKMSIILPLVIVLFVSGVYCPGIYSPGAGRPEIPEYIEYHEEHPSGCSLIKRSEIDGTTFYPFERADVRFNLMMEEEMRWTNVSSDMQLAWSITCRFPSDTEAQQFYKLVTRDRRSELVPLGRAAYLKNSDNIVLAERPNLYEGEGNATIVVKNDEGDVVLTFEKDIIDEVIQPEPTEMDLSIRSINPSGRRLYKLGFSSPTQAAAWIELLSELRQLSRRFWGR